MPKNPHKNPLTKGVRGMYNRAIMKPGPRRLKMPRRSVNVRTGLTLDQLNQVIDLVKLDKPNIIVHHKTISEAEAQAWAAHAEAEAQAWAACRQAIRQARATRSMAHSEARKRLTEKLKKARDARRKGA